MERPEGVRAEKRRRLWTELCAMQDELGGLARLAVESKEHVIDRLETVVEGGVEQEEQGELENELQEARRGLSRTYSC